MKIETLITMANQIGDFFGAYPDKDHAEQEIASHIKRFWALAMRDQLIKHTLENNGTGLHDVVKGAVTNFLSKEFTLSEE